MLPYLPLKIIYLYWRGENKGVDDLLNNSKCKNAAECGSLFEMYEKEVWDEFYQESLASLMKEKGVKYPKDLSQEDLKDGICVPKDKQWKR